MAMPNSSPEPRSKWLIAPTSMVLAQRKLSAQGADIVGFFSTRSPGKPPTPEEITTPWATTGHWIISTDNSGEAIDSIGYYRTEEIKYVPISLKLDLNANAGLFAAQSQVISAVVQTVNVEFMRWLQHHPNDLLRVHPGTFEQIVAEIFRDQGYDVEVLGSWNQADGGIDIIAVRKDTLAGSFRVGIQCKRYVKTRVVKADLVWALEGRLDKYRLNKGVLATTARFEKSVLSDLQDHLWRIELRDFEVLKKDIESWGRYERGATGLWLPT